MSTNPDQAGIAERELVLTRLFDAPPEKVFRAWTEPELITEEKRREIRHFLLTTIS